MQALNKNQNNYKFTRSLLFLFILLIMAVLLIRSALGVMNKERESAKYVRDLELEVSNLSKREGELKEGIAKLNTEEGVNEEIREKFSVTQEGEHVAIFVDGSSATSSEDRTNLPWYKRFWHAIMGDK